MFRHTGFAAIATAAVLLSACDRKSDGPTAPPPATVAAGKAAQTRDTVIGTVKTVVNGDSTMAVRLTTSDGLEYTLIGPVAAAVGADDGLLVWVSGEFQNSNDLYVETFEIRSTESSTCQNVMIVDMPPDCLSQIEKLNPHRAHLGNQVRPR